MACIRVSLRTVRVCASCRPVKERLVARDGKLITVLVGGSPPSTTGVKLLHIVTVTRLLSCTRPGLSAYLPLPARSPPRTSGASGRGAQRHPVRHHHRAQVGAGPRAPRAHRRRRRARLPGHSVAPQAPRACKPACPSLAHTQTPLKAPVSHPRLTYQSPHNHNLPLDLALFGIGTKPPLFA